MKLKRYAPAATQVRQHEPTLSERVVPPSVNPVLVDAEIFQREVDDMLDRANGREAPGQSRLNRQDPRTVLPAEARPLGLPLHAAGLFGLPVLVRRSSPYIWTSEGPKRISR